MRDNRELCILTFCMETIINVYVICCVRAMCLKLFAMGMLFLEANKCFKI